MIHNHDTLLSGGYKNDGLSKLKLTCPLDSFPSQQIYDLAPTLEHLDLSGTGLSSLPADFGDRLPNLKIAFFSNCRFAIFPAALSRCAQLEMVAFRGNGMTSIPEDALPPQLRWLILTNNAIETLPTSIGRCGRLQKCMLAGNRLRTLPDEMASCQRLALLRLSANRIESLPDWLFSLPELAFLSFAGNPCAGTQKTARRARRNSLSLPVVHWSDIDIHHVLGEGASGVISKGVRRRSGGVEEEVAVKLFRGALTSDGTPHDEMTACMSAGSHGNLIDVLGKIHDHPDAQRLSSEFQGGLVMQLIPPHYGTLGRPPTLQSCTRDHYDADAVLSASTAVSILEGIASAARHLHSSSIAHGDLYAHNILAAEDGHALLGDMGAATIYGDGRFPLLEKLEILAFSHLVEDVLGLVSRRESSSSPSDSKVVEPLQTIHRRCSGPVVAERPAFADVVKELRGLAEQLGGAARVAPN